MSRKNRHYKNTTKEDARPECRPFEIFNPVERRTTRTRIYIWRNKVNQ